MIKFGLQHPNFTYDGVGHEIFQTLKKRALYAEAKGFDSFWVMDHFFQIPHVGKLEEPMPCNPTARQNTKHRKQLNLLVAVVHNNSATTTKEKTTLAKPICYKPEYFP